MNKKISFLILIILVIILLTLGAWVVFNACNDNIDSATPTGTTTMAEITEPTTRVGIITDNVAFNGTTIGEFFVKPFEDILGNPLAERGNFVDYEGLVIFRTWNADTGEQDMMGQAVISDLSLLEINGITFENVTRNELIDMLGEPFTSSSDFVAYRVSNNNISYELSFRFDPENEGRIHNIGIYPTNNR